MFKGFKAVVYMVWCVVCVKIMARLVNVGAVAVLVGMTVKLL